MKKKLKRLTLIYLLITLSFLYNASFFASFLLLGIGVFVAIGTFFLLFLNKRVKRTNWFQNRIPEMGNYPTNQWYRENLERNYDIINIGSSSAKYAFNYSDCNVKSFNWAEQPQSLTYGFNILKTYFSILKRQGIVLISLCPFSGLNVSGKRNKTTNDKYFYILDSTLIENYPKVRKRREYPLLTMPKTSIKKLFKDDKAKTHNTSLPKNIDFKKDADLWIKNWMEEFSIKDLEAPLSEENIEGRTYRIQLLSDMIDFCQERTLQPILVIPPIHQALSEKLTPTFRENYIYSFIREANKANIPFYDYMDSKEFQEDKFFSNSFFLNEEGAKFFTNSLLNKLNINQ